MSSLTTWAKAYPYPALGAIILLTIALAWLALLMGYMLPPWTGWPGGLACLAGLLVLLLGLAYQHRRHLKAYAPARWPVVFRRWTQVFYVLTGLGFCLLGVMPATDPSPAPTVHPVAARNPAVAPALPPLAAKLHSQLTHLRAWLAPDSPRALANGGRVVLFVLAFLVALGLLILLAALTCALACNEMVALAMLLFFVGIPLVFVLLPLVSIRIFALTRRGSRRQMGLFTGFGIVLAGLLLLVLGNGGIVTVLGILGIAGIITGLSLLGVRLRRHPDQARRSRRQKGGAA